VRNPPRGGRLAAEFHARLPRAEADGLAVIYARFSTRFQASIADQVRAARGAVARNLFVPVDHICFDLAVPGSRPSERAWVGPKG